MAFHGVSPRDRWRLAEMANERERERERFMAFEICEELCRRPNFYSENALSVMNRNIPDHRK